MEMSLNTTTPWHWPMDLTHVIPITFCWHQSMRRVNVKAKGWPCVMSRTVPLCVTLQKTRRTPRKHRCCCDSHSTALLTSGYMPGPGDHLQQSTLSSSSSTTCNQKKPWFSPNLSAFRDTLQRALSISTPRVRGGKAVSAAIPLFCLITLLQ